MSLSLLLGLLLPKILAVVLLLGSAVPVKIPGLANFYPMVEVMIIYYWCLYRPRSMPNWFVFGLGILRDALTGLPLGVNALSNLVLRSAVISRRDMYTRESFLLVWQGFILFSAFVLLMQWIMLSLLAFEFQGLNMAFMQWVFSAALYPLFHYLCNVVHLIFPGNVSNA